MSDEKTKACIDRAMKDYELVDYTISVDKRNENLEGYAGYITFISVTGTKKTGVTETLHLCVKSSRENGNFRKQSGNKEIFEKEIFVYSEVKTRFDLLQRDNGIEKLIEIMPHCYATSVTDNSEILILEDLKSKGFGLCDKRKPMTFKHVRLILEAYGKWHALSMGLKSQKPDIFEGLVRNNVNMFSHFLKTTNTVDRIANEFVRIKNALISTTENDVLEHLQFSVDDVVYAITDMLFEEKDYHVILHGDCWNNNFLFKPADKPTNPSEVRILDWQCSGLASPIFDLSHFIYCCCDTAVQQNVTELLEIYYKSFSDCLKSLSCEPSEIFTFDALVEHWKMFSKYGLFIGNFIVKVCGGEAYIKRIRNNLLHYVQNIKS